MNTSATKPECRPRAGLSVSRAAFAAFAIVAAAAIAVSMSLPALAAPAAGTVIGNQASATYNDAGGTPRTATSNLVQTTITQVKSFTLVSTPQARTAAAGQTVYYPHTLTNTGNGTDTYALSGPAAGAGFAHTSLVYYIDADGNGVPDNFTAILTTGPIAAAGIYRFVAAGTVPGGAVAGQTGEIIVSATDTTPTTLTNSDTTTVANSAISVTKSLSLTSGPSPNAGPITVTLSYANSGSGSATNLQLRDTLPAGLAYIAGSGLWSVTGATLLTDAAGGDPAGIAYEFTTGQVVATIATVPAGFSGTVTFQVSVNAGLAPGLLNNTAQYQTTTQAQTNTNTASYQVVRVGGVTANGSTTDSTDLAGENVTFASAPAGSTITFDNVIWNTGSAPDSFVISLAGQGNWPAGTTFTLLQSDGVTALIANTTPPVPVYGAGCPPGFVADGTAPTQYCGYVVKLRVQLPMTATAAGPPAAPFQITKTATSAFDSTRSNTVIDQLTTITANSVDLTNNSALPGIPGQGQGATGTTVITTNTVTPSAAGATITRFRLYANNAGIIGDSFDLSVAGTPPGWSVVFRADASGLPADCSAAGAILTNTGAVNAGAARLICAEVTVPATTSGQAPPGTYNLDFTATSALNGAVSDVKRDAVVVSAVHGVTLTPNNTQQTFPGASVTYTHVLTNVGNVAYVVPTNPVTFTAGFLTDSRAGSGWSSIAYVDGNGNGVFDPGIDDVPANQITTSTQLALGVNATRTLFVRVFAPAGALVSDPPNVSTLTATYNATSTSATDSTSVTNGLALAKELVAVSCAAAGPHAGYSAGPIASGPSTAPGQCVAYRITATNAATVNTTNVVIGDNIPAFTTQRNSCGAPSTSLGTIASPGDGNAGTITATYNTGPLAPGQSVVVTFCVRIDPSAAGAPPAGTVIPNQASATATIGATPLSVLSNVVQLTASAAATTGVTLVAGSTLQVGRGESVYFPHTLTNTGAVADTYQLSVVDQPGTFDLLGLEIMLDANGDGRPDSLAPVTAPVALAPGQAFRFVVRAIAPLNAPANGIDRFEVRASSLAPGGPAPVSNLDIATILVVPVNPPLPDGIWVEKFFSLTEGPSPSEEFDVLIRYSNSTLDSATKRDVTITDRLPEGLAYVPGSARWSWAGTAPLTDAPGGDPPGIAFDFGATAPGTAWAVIAGMQPGVKGELRFRVRVEPGREPGEIITNVARFRYIDSQGVQTAFVETRPANYLVLGTIDLTLTGERIPVAEPGTTVTFNNLLTNRGTIAETFNIVFGASTFPAGTPMRLYGPDGTTPLADTNGDGIPDVGVVAPGRSVGVVVKVDLPGTLVQGEYSVQKTARSARSPSRSATTIDLLASVGKRCRIDLTPDNQSQGAYGRHVTYTHYLENLGNCEEPVRVIAGFIADSRPGWVSAAFIDNPVAGGASIPGVLDRTDTPVTEGWTALLAPGQGLRILVDVLAPNAPAAAVQAAKEAKALVETNVTTLTVESVTGGSLKVTDTTTIDDQDSTLQPQNVLRNFTDPTYRVPTAWAVLGGTAWLRADAAACNAAPDVAETRTLVITGPGGEREEVLATETGPDTGVFVASAMPIRGPPVVAGDRILQGRAFDVLDAEILGCGRRIAAAITLTDPVGVVFDSSTNEPVAGAVVTLVAASGGQCSAAPVSTAGNPATTDAGGRYAFPSAAAGDYCLAVTPPNGYAAPSKVPYGQLAPGRNLAVTGATSGGSYGQPFRASGNGIVVDVPVDPAALSGLFVQKAASRMVVDLGGFVDYAVRVRNGTGRILDQASVQLVDDLPAGFAYVSGSARVVDRALAEPAGAGPRLVFGLGGLARGQEIVVSYRVRVGPGALQGDGTNRVQAAYTANGATTASNVASAKVQVIGGVFSDRGFILGKVFLDCNANGEQDAGEAGVPGVRLFIEDGTYVVTDGQGRYSFYGLTNRTHSLKVDFTTLPAGAKLVPIGTRHLGDGASRLVDLKAGEMHRGDFAIAGCEGPVADELKARAQAMMEGVDPLAALAGTQLATDARSVPDVKALPASGIVSTTGQAGGAPALNAPAGSSRVTPYAGIVEIPAAARPTPSPMLPMAASSPPPAVPLEQLVPGLDKEVGFVGLKDGDTLAFAQATIRVKGTAGATLKLSVNGIEIPGSRIGKRSTLEETQVQALEYIGVELRPGANELSISQVDPFGTPRGTATIRVTAPGRAGRLAIELPQGGAVADGKTLARVVVKVLDDNGVPVTSRTPVTLVSSVGLWRVDDADSAEPGVQAFVEGGRAEFALAPPLEPGSSLIVVTSGKLARAEARLDFLPELRSLIATGVIEGVVNMRNINSRALVPTRAADGFEQELRQFSREWNDGKTSAGARAAVFLKGKIKGDFLLTAAYDSDKDTRERLFRDILPDEFYPVYGDSAVRGYDAQSTSKLYVRIDKDRSYLLWGDFTTQVPGDMRRLSNYSRSLTGVTGHYENERVSANAFASRDTTRQVIEELRANGTSGPYQLSTQGALVNSEKVEVITRDRNQSSIVLASLPQARFTDYEIEPLTGRILFRSPVSSVDRDLNPVFVRVTYEVDQGGQEFWVGGVDAQVRLTDRVEVGGTYVKDENPLLPFTLAGANAAVKLGESTYVIGEVARTENGTRGAKGDAARLEVKHESKDLKAQAFVARSDPEFDNPGAWLSKGRAEAGGRAEYRIREGTQVRAEALRTEDVVSGSVRDGALVAITQEVAKYFTLELGMRYAADKGTTSPVPPVQGLPPPEPLPDEVTTVRARITGQVPYVSGASVYGEAEVDVTDADRRILAAGGEFALPNRGRLYARHEFISSITGPYGLNATERQNTTAVGVDFDYMQDGRLFSEYRIRDAMSGGDAEAAIGLKNLWTLAPGLRLGTSIERVHAVSGTGQGENTAGAVALEYTANPLWKGTTRLELRDASTAESLLFTVGLAAKISRDWTALARNAYSLQRAKDGGAERVVERMQAGLAWRDTETNQWNALGRVEHRLDKDETQVGLQLKSSTTIVSLNADWQPRRPFLVSGRYAAKWTTDESNGLTSKYRAQVIGARATWEFAPRWDVGFVTSLLVGESFDSRHYGVGLELGYLVTTNLWVSAGYNFFGYRDADLSGADYTSKGPYVRLRYKFDEGIIGEGLSGSPKSAAGDAAPARAEPTVFQPSTTTVPATGGGYAPLVRPSPDPASAAGQGGPL